MFNRYILKCIVIILVLLFLTAGKRAPTKEAFRGFGLTNSNIPAIVKASSKAGITLHRSGENIIWSTIEKTYLGERDWSRPDKFVRELQESGADLVLWLIPDKTSRKISGRKQDHYGYYPARFMNRWEKFVTDVVERYDGDGVKDMPGLKYPVRYYQLGNEWYLVGESWKGTTNEYIETLKTTYKAVKSADPNTYLILNEISDIDPYHVLSMAKSEDYEEQDILTLSPEILLKRLKAAAPQWQKNFDFVERILAATDYYDIAISHSNHDYKQVWYMTEFMKYLMTKNGGQERPIWSGDSASMILLGTRLISMPPWAHQNMSEEDKSLNQLQLQLLAILDSRNKKKGRENNLHRYFNEQGWSLPKPNDQVYQAAWTWHNKIQAQVVVKKIVAAIDAGRNAVFITGAYDWPHYPMVEWRYTGLVNLTNKSPRPAMQAYANLVETIEGFKEVKKLDMKDYKIFAFSFKFSNNKEVIVAWYDDFDLDLPYFEAGSDNKYLDDIPDRLKLTTSKKRNKEITLPVRSAKVTVEKIQINKQPPQPEVVLTTNGMLSINLTETPVIIKPVGN